MDRHIIHRRSLYASRAFLVIALFSSAAGAASASDSKAIPSEDELFGTGPALVEELTETMGDLVTGNFEESTGVGLSGSFVLSFTAGIGNGNFTPGSGRSSPGLSLSLDARPETGLRFHSRVRYVIMETDLTGELRIDELFVDLWREGYGMLRAGKQAAAWGLGHWWSPADVLSLAPIDELAPEGEREGTLALKYGLPLGLGGLTLYAAGDGASSLDQVALAGRLDLVAGGAELGFGAFYRPDGKLAPRLLSTISFGLGSFDCYAETVISFGSERKLVEFAGSPTVSSPEGLLFSGTIGMGYTDSDAEGRWDLSFAAEYYLNGAGIGEGVAYAENRDELVALVAMGGLTVGELRGYGRHYGAIALRLEDLFSTAFGAGLDWLSNLAEGSGYYRAVAAFEPDVDLRIEAGFAAWYGQVGGEYSISGRQGSFVTSFRILEHATFSLDWPLYGAGIEATAGFVLRADF